MAAAIRPVWARIGLTGLNLLLPGLGLLRAKGLRVALPYLIAGPVFLSVLLVAAMTLPRPGLTAVGTVMFVMIAGWLWVLVASTIPVWRDRSPPSRPIPIDRRWYVITAIYVAMAYLLPAEVQALWTLYKPFYIPSESMMPTFVPGDRIVAEMRVDPRQFRRGDILLFRVAGQARVARLVAVAGDRVSVVNDIPSVEGQPATMVHAGPSRSVPSSIGQVTGKGWTEQLPGETRPHAILTTAATPDEAMFATYPPTIVPAGHIFVMGDNRDMAADSRVPKPMGGVEMVPIAEVIGRPLVITWNPRQRRIGAPFN